MQSRQSGPLSPEPARQVSSKTSPPPQPERLSLHAGAPRCAQPTAASGQRRTSLLIGEARQKPTLSGSVSMVAPPVQSVPTGHVAHWTTALTMLT